MIKRDEAKRKILAEWPSWSATQSTPTLGNGLLFFFPFFKENAAICFSLGRQVISGSTCIAG
jgi:hypothetical protein